jgi:hypothetical protein
MGFVASNCPAAFWAASLHLVNMLWAACPASLINVPMAASRVATVTVAALIALLILRLQ